MRLFYFYVQRLTKRHQNKEVNQMFIENSHHGAIFQAKLKQMIKILSPFAKAIACLESSQANPADVYLFWLAILSTLKQLFEDDTAGIKDEDASAIRAVTNARFRELLEEGPDDCYISAFYLDPRMFADSVCI